MHWLHPICHFSHLWHTHTIYYFVHNWILVFDSNSYFYRRTLLLHSTFVPLKLPSWARYRNKLKKMWKKKMNDFDLLSFITTARVFVPNLPVRCYNTTTMHYLWEFSLKYSRTHVNVFMTWLFYYYLFLCYKHVFRLVFYDLYTPVIGFPWKEKQRGRIKIPSKQFNWFCVSDTVS